jgi:hypothetical protein
MKIFKKALKWLASIILILFVLALILPYFFKDKIAAVAKEEINKQVNAKVDFGDFDLSMITTFPDFNFEINDLSVVGTGNFDGDTLIYMGSFGIEIDLFSVFGEKYEIKSIVVKNPVVNALVVNSQANWDIAKEDSTATEETQETGSEPFVLALKSFKIKNGRIIYDDKDANIYSELKNLNFLLSGDLSEDFTVLSIKATIDELTAKSDGIKYLNKVKTDFTAGIAADLNNSKYTFKDNKLKLNALTLGFDGYIGLPNDNDITMDISFKSAETSFKNILSLIPAIYMTDFEDVETHGKMAIKGKVKGTYNDNSLPAFDMVMNVDKADFKYPDLPARAEDIAIDLRVSNKDGVDDHTVIDLKKFHINLGGNAFDAAMVIKTPVSDPYIDSRMSGTIDLDKLKDIVPLEDMTVSGIITSDVKARGNLSTIENEKYNEFDATGSITLRDFRYESEDFPQGIVIPKAGFKLSPEYLQLTSFDAKAGKSDFHANGRIDNIFGYYLNDELLSGSFNFKSHHLDIDELTGYAGEEESEETTDTTAGEDYGIVEIPRNINFVLNSQIDKVVYDNMEITALKGVVRLDSGKASLKDVVMNMLGGRIKMNGSYSTRNPKKPAADFDLAIVDFDIPQTYKTFNTVRLLAPVAEYCKGKFSATSSFSAALLDDMSPDMKTLNSTGKIITKQIVIGNSEVFRKIDSYLKSGKFKTTTLNDINLGYKIEDGNLRVKPFVTKFGKNSQMEFGGTQNLDRSMNYKMHFKIPRKEFGSKANESLQSLYSGLNKNGVKAQLPDIVEFDAFVQGTATNPEVKVGLKDGVNNAVEDVKKQVKEEVKKEVDKARAEAVKKAREEAARLQREADAKGKELVAAAEKTAAQIRKSGKEAADNIRAEAERQAKKIEDAAKNQPGFMQTAAKKSADKVRAEAEKKAKATEAEANKKADATVAKAKKEAGRLNKEAKEKGDLMIKKAEEGK